MPLSKEEALKLAKERGLVPQDYQLPKKEISKEEAFKMAIERGLVKPREDGAGFLVRSKFSFADSDVGRKQVLEDEYGKGKAIKLGDRWLVKDKKGWNYVDEKGLSWNDAADLIGDIPEMIGGGVGGTVGLSFGGVGSVAGAGAGSAGGRAVKKGIANLLGIDNKQTTNESLEDIGESALWGAGGQALGLEAIKRINKILAPYKNKMTPDAVMRKEIAEKHGIKLTPAQITQARSLGMIENGMKNNFASTNTMQKFIDEKQLAPFQTAIRNTSPNESLSTIGATLKESINQTNNANKRMFNKEYQSLAGMINKDIEVPTLIKKAQEIVEANKNLPDGLKDDAVKIANQILEMPTDKVDYNTLSKLRTNLGEKAKSGAVTGDIGSGQYKMMKGAINNDFDTFATYNGLGGTKKEIDEAYKTFKNTYENNMIKNIVGTNKKDAVYNEKVVDQIVNAKEPTRIDIVNQASNNPRAVKDAVIGKVVNESKVPDHTNPMYGSDYISPTRFATQTEKFGENLNKVGADDVRELGKIAENIKFSESFANHSNTAPTLQTSGIAGIAGSFPFYPMSKAYTSNIGRKYLTDGLGQINMKKSGFGAVFAPLFNQD